MLFVLIPIAWLAITVVVVAACRMSAYGERNAGLSLADFRCERLHEDSIRSERRVRDDLVVWQDAQVEVA